MIEDHILTGSFTDKPDANLKVNSHCVHLNPTGVKLGKSDKMEVMHHGYEIQEYKSIYDYPIPESEYVIPEYTSIYNDS